MALVESAGLSLGLHHPVVALGDGSGRLVPARPVRARVMIGSSDTDTTPARNELERDVFVVGMTTH